MLFTRYNSIKLGRWPVGFGVDYNSEDHLTGDVHSTPLGDTRVLTFSIGMAESVIDTLERQLEHSRTDYYKWGQRKASSQFCN